MPAGNSWSRVLSTDKTRQQSVYTDITKITFLGLFLFGEKGTFFFFSFLDPQHSAH